MDSEIEFADQDLSYIHLLAKQVEALIRDYRSQHPHSVNPLRSAAGAASEVVCCLAAARHNEGESCRVVHGKSEVTE